jgi:hypothetical protein
MWKSFHALIKVININFFKSFIFTDATLEYFQGKTENTDCIDEDLRGTTILTKAHKRVGKESGSVELTHSNLQQYTHQQDQKAKLYSSDQIGADEEEKKLIKKVKMNNA